MERGRRARRGGLLGFEFDEVEIFVGFGTHLSPRPCHLLIALDQHTDKISSVAPSQKGFGARRRCHWNEEDGTVAPCYFSSKLVLANEATQGHP